MKAKILYWTCIFSNKENSTDNDNLTIRTKKTDRLRNINTKKSTKNSFSFFLFFFKELAGFEPATLDFWVLLFYETLT